MYVLVVYGKGLVDSKNKTLLAITDAFLVTTPT